VTIVEHENNSNESQELIRQIVEQLFKQGVPVSEIFTEVQGRGKEDEIVESLDEDLKKLIRNYNIQYEHNNILAELLGMNVEDFAF
jgi:nucleotide-binding universal stress UspA family protein